MFLNLEQSWEFWNLLLLFSSLTSCGFTDLRCAKKNLATFSGCAWSRVKKKSKLLKTKEKLLGSELVFKNLRSIRQVSRHRPSTEGFRISVRMCFFEYLCATWFTRVISVKLLSLWKFWFLWSKASTAVAVHSASMFIRSSNYLSVRWDFETSKNSFSLWHIPALYQCNKRSVSGISGSSLNHSF